MYTAEQEFEHLLPRINFNSPYKNEQHINRTYTWFSTDSYPTYHENTLNRLDELQKYNWVGSHITYTFNSYGFRSEEFTDDPTIIFLGCSNTFGTGLSAEHTWPQIVSKLTGYRCANLAIDGTSPDCAFRICLGYIDIVKPKLVIYNQSPGIRLEVVTKQGPKNYGIAGIKLTDQFLLDFIEKDDNDWLNRMKNVFAMEMLCKTRGIQFLYTPNFHHDHSGDKDYARDLIHLGIKHNHAFALYVVEQLEKKLKFNF